MARQNRAEVVRSLRWQLGPVLPEELKAKLSYSEVVYFVDHSKAIASYMSEMDIDLTVVSGVPRPTWFYFCIAPPVTAHR